MCCRPTLVSEKSCPVWLQPHPFPVQEVVLLRVKVPGTLPPHGHACAVTSLSSLRGLQGGLSWAAQCQGQGLGCRIHSCFLTKLLGGQSCASPPRVHSSLLSLPSGLPLAVWGALFCSALVVQSPDSEDIHEAVVLDGSSCQLRSLFPVIMSLGPWESRVTSGST